jgi:hypothetical protein
MNTNTGHTLERLAAIPLKIEDVKKGDFSFGESSIIIWIIIISLALTATCIHYFSIDLAGLEKRIELHQSIISNSAPSPYNYRVLAPQTNELLIRALSVFIKYKTAFAFSYLIFNYFCILLTFLFLMIYLRLWFNNIQSLVGVLFAAISMIFTFKDYFYQPWSLLEVPLFTLFLWTMYKKRMVFGLLIVIIASLNRETGIFLPLAFIVSQFTYYRLSGDGYRKLRYSALYLISSILIIGGLRLILGPSEHVRTIKEMWDLNTESLSVIAITVINIIAFQGALCYFAVRGSRAAPEYVRKSFRVIPLYLAAIAVFGIWKEVRLLMMLYPILLPAALSYIFSKKQGLSPEYSPPKAFW